MKSILLATAAVAVLFSSSCNKQDNVETGQMPYCQGALLMNSWNVGQVTHRATAIQATGAMLMATETAGSATSTFTCQFNGNSLPDDGGNFKIVVSNPGPYEVAIQLNTGASTYSASGNDQKIAQVTVQNKKVMMTTQAFWAVSSTSATDSVQVYGGISQQ